MESSIKRLVPELISRLRSGVSLTSVSQCVEELVLNAIDAEANCIAVRLDLNFGKIQVIDNGHGIPPRHLDLIGERYVSSKCHTVEDLSDLKYHGFRGEALASLRDVAAVLEITSKVAESSHTYFKSFQFGKIGKTSIAATPRPSIGTTVTVLDYLYNLPVRKNLSSEGRNIEDCRQRLECIALMHPAVSFSLRDDTTGNVVLQTRKCSTILGTFTFLFGQPRSLNMKDMDYASGKRRLQGLMSIENSGSKDIQFLYVNRRRVVKTGLHKVVKSALRLFVFQKKQTQSPGKGLPQHPNYVLNLSCPLDEYDVCFEPQKTMIEFVHADEIASFIEDATANFARLHGLEEARPESCRKRVSGEDVEDESKEYGLEIMTENTKNALHSLAVKRTKKSSETLAIDAHAIGSTSDPKEKEQSEMSRIKLIRSLDINPDAEVICYNSALDRLKRKVERLKQQERENKTLDSSARFPSKSRSVRLGNKCGHISSGNDLENLKGFLFDRRRTTLSRTGASGDRISTSSPPPKKTNSSEPISKKHVSEISHLSERLVTFSKINTTRITTSDKTRECPPSADKTNTSARKANCHQSGDSKSPVVSSKINILEKTTEGYQNCPRPTSRVSENACQVIGDTVRDSSYFPMLDVETDHFFEVRKLFMQGLEKSKRTGTSSRSEIDCAAIIRTSSLSGGIVTSSTVDSNVNAHQTVEVEKSLVQDSGTSKCTLSESATDFAFISRTSNLASSITNSSNVDTICGDVHLHDQNWKRITSMEDDFLFSSHDSEMNRPTFTNASDKFSSSQTLVESSSDVTISDSERNKTFTDLIHSAKTIQIKPLSAERPSRNMPDKSSSSQILVESSSDVAISDEVSFIPDSERNKTFADPIHSAKSIQIKHLSAERPSRNMSEDLRPYFEDRNQISPLEMVGTSKEATLSPDGQKQNTLTNGLDVDNAASNAKNIVTGECRSKSEGLNTKRTWIPYEDSTSGNTIYINAETGNSSYSPPPEPSSLTADDATKEGVPAPSSHFALSHNCDPFLARPASERPLFDGHQNSCDGQVSNLLKEWRNPTFQRSQEVLGITPSGPSKTSAVKVYNTLQQYRFEKSHLRHVKFVGQVDCKFIACLMSYQGDENLLVLFDQHAVHERIRLEKFVEEIFEDKPKGARMIKTDLEPTMVLEVEQEVVRRANMYRERMSEWGTDVSVDSLNTLEVHAVPACLTRKGYPNETVVQNLVTEELETLHETGCLSTLPKTLLDVLSSRACHGAIKFGDPLEPEKAKEMITSLSNCKLPFQCAHGRPSLAPILDLRHLPRPEPDDKINLDFI